MERKNIYKSNNWKETDGVNYLGNIEKNNLLEPYTHKWGNQQRLGPME